MACLAWLWTVVCEVQTAECQLEIAGYSSLDSQCGCPPGQEQGPDQRSLVVKVDGVPPEGLRLDERGQASIDLRAGESRQTVVTRARGPGDGTHTLTLDPAAEARVTVDALVLSERASELLVHLLWGLCGLLILVGVALWQRNSPE